MLVKAFGNAGKTALLEDMNELWPVQQREPTRGEYNACRELIQQFVQNYNCLSREQPRVEVGWTMRRVPEGFVDVAPTVEIVLAQYPVQVQ